MSIFEAGLVAIDGDRIHASGEFRLKGVPKGRQLRVGIAGLSERGLLGSPVVVRTGDTGIKLDAQPGLRIAGTLIVPSRGAPAGARVQAVSAEAKLAVRRHETLTELGGGGSFAIGGLAPGDYYLVVRSTGDRILAVHGPVAAGADGVEIACGPLTLLQGRVVGQGPAAESEVEVWARDSGVFLGSPTATLAGNFALRVPYGTACTLIARSGSSAAMVSEVRPGAQAVLLELSPSMDLRAELVGFSGLVSVAISRAGYRASLWVRPPRGLHLPSMPPGQYRVRAITWLDFYTRLYFGQDLAPAVDFPEGVLHAGEPGTVFRATR